MEAALTTTKIDSNDDEEWGSMPWRRPELEFSTSLSFLSNLLFIFFFKTTATKKKEDDRSWWKTRSFSVEDGELYLSDSDTEYDVA